MVEREAFARRQVYADGVYSSATWPANQPMCMHHELSYRLEFPGLMLFACLSAPTAGGATAVAGFADGAGGAAGRVGRAVRAGGLAAHPQLQRRDRGVVWRRRSGPRTGRGGGLLPGQRDRVRVAARWGVADLAAPQRGGAASGDRTSAAGSTRSRSSTSGRSTRRSASTSWTSTAPTGCRSTPASGTATRSARTSSS